MHYLRLFHSRNGLICTHANERRVWMERQTGWRGNREGRLTGSLKIEAMENTHMNEVWACLTEDNTVGATCCAVSVKRLQHADHRYLTHGSHPSAKIAYSLCLFLCPRHVASRRRVTMHKLSSDMLIWNVSLAKALFLLLNIIKNFLMLKRDATRRSTRALAPNLPPSGKPLFYHWVNCLSNIFYGYFMLHSTHSNNNTEQMTNCMNNPRSEHNAMRVIWMNFEQIISCVCCIRDEV